MAIRAAIAEFIPVCVHESLISCGVTGVTFGVDIIFVGWNGIMAVPAFQRCGIVVKLVLTEAESRDGMLEIRPSCLSWREITASMVSVTGMTLIDRYAGAGCADLAMQILVVFDLALDRGVAIQAQGSL